LKKNHQTTPKLKPVMKYILWLIRLIVGVLFIFSGLVKANDPLGLSYKMDEFFEVWGMLWATKYSLLLSVLMIGFEIIAGVALLIGAAFGVFSFLLLLLIIFFTFLTAYVYLPHTETFAFLLTEYPKFFPKLIEECGCFGDCIKISNEETFWKDVLLLVLVIVLFIYRKRIKPIGSSRQTFIVMMLTTIFAFGAQWWALEHLPFYDCMPYKKGTYMPEKMVLPPDGVPDEYETVLLYKKDGVVKEFTTANFPWQDSTWVFVDSKTKLVKKGTDIPIKDFVINDINGTPHTDEILSRPGFTLLLFIRSIDKARTDKMDQLRSLMQQAQDNGVPFYILTSADFEETQRFVTTHQLPVAAIYTVDVIASKTAMRSNPGLMLIEKGTIRGKYSFRDYPTTITRNGNTVTIR
jgi:uncharacterized membrane protein YphA (DoxX/SURF4 family)